MTDPLQTQSSYEISVLFGPCSQDEAEGLLEFVAEAVYGRPENYGACVACRIDEGD